MEWNDVIENPENEKERLEKIIDKNPKDAEAYYKLGEVYENIGDDPKAIEYCEKALGIDPDNMLYLAFHIFLTLQQ